jgi:Undecaprenyl-phosphate galactose phosphotransferase WbaP
METMLRSADISEIISKNHELRSSIWSRNARLLMSMFLGAADIISLLLAAGLALGIRTLIGTGVKLDLYLDLIPLVIFALIVYAWRGLYPAIGLGEVEELRRLTITTTLIFLSLATFSFLTKSPPRYSRSIFILAWMLALGLVPLGRSLIRTVCARSQIWGVPVAVIGGGKHVQKLVNFLRQNLKVGFRPVIVFENDDGVTVPLAGVPVFPSRNLSQVCQVVPIKTALIITSGENEKVYKQMDQWQGIFERLVLVDVQNSTHLLWISVRNLGEFIGLEIRQNLLNSWAQVYKRAMDVFGAFVGLVFSLPVFAAVSVLIKMDSPGPVFYHQIRIGQNGDHFRMIKFRTMYQDADSVLKKYLDVDLNLRMEWEKYQKLKNDPRITRVGNLLRLLSVDELPQMWNVLKGEMSLVGPRPFFPEQKSLYGDAFENYKRVRPGITGLWQIFGRNHSTFEQRAQWDEYYVRNWSPWLDIFTLVRTVGTVIRQEGAY